MPFDGTIEHPLIALIERAQEILLKEGWTTKTFGHPGSPKCVLGAIRAAAGCDLDSVRQIMRRAEMEPLQIALVAALKKRKFGSRLPFYVQKTWQLVADWNDTSATGRDDAVDFLESVKIHLREKVHAV